MKLENSMFEIRLQMFRHGSHKIRKMSDFIGTCDLDDIEKMKSAFPNIFERYDALASLEKKQQPELGS